MYSFIFLVFVIIGFSIYTRRENKSFESNKAKAIRSTQMIVASNDGRYQMPVENEDIVFFQSMLADGMKTEYLGERGVSYPIFDLSFSNITDLYCRVRLDEKKSRVYIKWYYKKRTSRLDTTYNASIDDLRSIIHRYVQ